MCVAFPNYRRNRAESRPRNEIIGRNRAPYRAPHVHKARLRVTQRAPTLLGAQSDSLSSSYQINDYRFTECRPIIYEIHFIIHSVQSQRDRSRVFESDGIAARIFADGLCCLLVKAIIVELFISNMLFSHSSLVE